jgi:hypothetical protein
MTAVPPTGALSTPAAAWHTIDWYTVHRTVRRLQARLVKARGITAFSTERLKGLSGLRGNLYGPFLGGWVGVILPGYPI